MTTRKNFFVVGDLMIDHAVFVESPDPPADPAPGEVPYRVVRRQTTAGGAANTARILAALYPHGKTYLWGILGRSHWGTFREILQDSQALDGTFNNIELRGVQDETDAPMNTITRLVLMEDPMCRVVRFDDVGHAHVSDAKRETLRYHLERIHKKDTLDAVIINDLDRGCMTTALVSDIAKFATEKQVPLFVDPKRKREKYQNIKGTAILPNLKEWCRLVDDEERETWWRNNLNRPDTLVEMAERSFHYLGKFQYHIITCDKDGAVIIAPKLDTRNRYAVYLAPPERAQVTPVKDPLGPGDLMTGVVAAEYDEAQGTQGLLQAFQKANVAVACYREMAYQRMPPKATVDKRQAYPGPWLPGPTAETTMGMLFLPKEERISLGRLKTAVPGLVSKDDQFKDQVAGLIESLRTGIDSSKPLSILLAAPSGSGKTLIARALKGDLGRELRLGVIEVKLNEIIEAPERFFEEQGSRYPKQSLLFIVDEALKMENGAALKDRRTMVVLLNMAEQKGARFLFMDALFCEPSQLAEVHLEIQSRCDPHTLLGLEGRPEDIAHILGAQMLESGALQGIREVVVQRTVLRAVIDEMLAKGGNVRNLHKLVEGIRLKANGDHKGGETLQIRVTHLPQGLGRAGSERQVGPSLYVYER